MPVFALDFEDSDIDMIDESMMAGSFCDIICSVGGQEGDDKKVICTWSLIKEDY